MRAAVVLPLLVVGCASAGSTLPEPAPIKANETTAPRPPAWAPVTRSPWRADGEEIARETALATACGSSDEALARVAKKLVDRRARGLGAPDPDAVVAMLRAEGEPHVRPRVVSASGRAPLSDDLVRTQLESVKRDATRCGVATAVSSSGKELLVAVAIDALADLGPLPTRARAGEWLTLDAKINVPTTEARVFLLGPRGAPRTIPTTFDRNSGSVRAHFALDRPGAFTVQVVGDLAHGPTPLLEARVFADVEPPEGDETGPAPGEEAGGGAQDAEALTRMIASLRASEGAGSLARDARLDALARAHAERMRDRGLVGHDLGDGDPKARFEGELLEAKTLGENVARAESVELAHRALHASPSHRLNLLRPDFTHVGIGVARRSDGALYVCELFTSNLR